MHRSGVRSPSAPPPGAISVWPTWYGSFARYDGLWERPPSESAAAGGSYRYPCSRAGSPTPIALWLVPASPWRQRFGALMNSPINSTVFEPHITLHVGTLPDALQVSGRFAAAAASRPPMTLVCGGTRHDKEHFRTLFVPFDDRRVNELRDALVDATELRGNYDLCPHLSLLYCGGLDVGRRARAPRGDASVRR
jgi:hypothetical protein